MHTSVTCTQFRKLAIAKGATATDTYIAELALQVCVFNDGSLPELCRHLVATKLARAKFRN